jgi:uncharacterized protein (TIGR03032 family)
VNVEGGWERAPVPQGLFELSSSNATASEGFAGWLAGQRVALAFTTGDRLVFAGRDGSGRLRLSEHARDATGGLAAASPRSLRLVSDWQLWRLEDALDEGRSDDAGHDRLYLPQSAHTTGFLGSLDVAIGAGGRPLFTSAVCNCVATTSPRLSFTALWKPPFVSQIGGGDRCHLTGLALDGDGELAYVTAAAASDAAGGWQEPAALRGGGVVVDVRSGETVAAGLSLPHSPRLHGGRLLVAEAGTGALLVLDPADGSREEVVRVPGLARGLALHGDHAVLGCSRIASGSPYDGVEVAERDDLRHQLVVVDLVRGAVAERLELHAASGETIAIAVLEETARPGWGGDPGGLVERVAIAAAPARPAE